MSSAISNSSARRRRTIQPKIQEKNIQNTDENKINQPQEYNHINDIPPTISMKNSIYLLNNKIRFIESVLSKETVMGGVSDTEINELSTTLKDVKKSVDDFSLQMASLELNMNNLKLIVGIHDNYINKIKTMVDFENVETTNKDLPQLIENTN